MIDILDKDTTRIQYSSLVIARREKAYREEVESFDKVFRNVIVAVPVQIVRDLVFELSE